ncbi:MAG TPA: N-acetyl-alpha-D-glucosaminyl L-malate synthase BshA [Planctomycetota bacterium]|nr:N-acetyl-alpha-D-glucosaminyl L-malate synthase BshA [Planctomycetota bacterium]
MIASDRPLRIGVACYPTFGGSGAVAADLACALAARGHEVHVISYATPVRFEPGPGLTFHEVDVSSYPLFKFPPYEMALSSRLSDVALRHGLDVIHAHYAVPHSVAAYLAREIVGRERLRVVTTLHGTDITLIGSDPAYRPMTRFALRRSDAVTAVSEYLRDETRRVVCDDCRIRVIGNFVDAERFHPRLRGAGRARYARPAEKLLVHASNFRPVKRVADVVKIFALTARALPARLVMAGEGPERATAERVAAELGVADRVSFVGAVSDVERLLANADAFLLPSDGESFGLAALEALACGTPVVGARAGGLPEVVTDGVDGVLEAVGACEAMAARLVDLLRAPEAWARAGAAGRAKVERFFRSELVVPVYEAVYREALAD